MKSVFFYTNARTYDHTLGITRKIFAEINAFRELGYNVTYSGYLEDGVAIFNNENQVVLQKRFKFKNDSLNHALRRGLILNLCLDFLKSANVHYDFSYVRYHYYDYLFIKLLKTLRKRSDILVVEAHSAPKFEKRLSFKTYYALKDYLWKRKAKHYVDFVAAMTNDDILWGIKTVKITNGIDLDAIRIHNYRGKQDDINLISASFAGPEHGYDRVIKGIYLYYKNGGKRNVHFHMVGTIMTSTEELINKLGLSENCHFYGQKTLSELQDIYDYANIGIAHLANHRRGTNYVSALKTKEYIAKGLPIVYACDETVLKDYPYALKFELNDEPLNIQRIIEFYDQLPKKDLSLVIRGHLNEKDTWLYQMTTVVKAVNEIKKS